MSFDHRLYAHDIRGSVAHAHMLSKVGVLSDDERHLFVATNGAIQVVDLNDATPTALHLPEGLTIPSIDGLYFYKNSLIAIQPFEAEKAVVRYTLNEARDTITGETILEATHPLLNQPTTGAIVDGWFYYIANSQLQHFRRLYDTSGDAYDRKQLSDVVLLKVNL